MVKKQLIYNLLFVAMLLFGSSLIAQTTTGVVSDASGALPGVSVVEKGTNNGTSTDFDGKYTLTTVTTNPILVLLKLFG